MGVLIAALICLANCGGAMVAVPFYKPNTENLQALNSSVAIVKLTVIGPRKCCIPLVKETLEQCPGVKSVKHKRSVYYLETDSAFKIVEAQQKVLEEGKKHNKNFKPNGNSEQHLDWTVITLKQKTK